MGRKYHALVDGLVARVASEKQAAAGPAGRASAVIDAAEGTLRTAASSLHALATGAWAALGIYAHTREEAIWLRDTHGICPSFAVPVDKYDNTPEATWRPGGGAVVRLNGKVLHRVPMTKASFDCLRNGPDAHLVANFVAMADERTPRFSEAMEVASRLLAVCGPEATHVEFASIALDPEGQDRFQAVLVWFNAPDAPGTTYFQLLEGDEALDELARDVLQNHPEFTSLAFDRKGRFTWTLGQELPHADLSSRG